MIKLSYPLQPVELTNEVIEELTFKAKEKPVWKQPYIEKALLKMSFEKCCFCETKVNEESKYMEIEHFYPKSLYPNEVIAWENLLPICGRCNKQKSDHDTKQQPIIYPAKDNPKIHLELRNYRLYGLTQLGKETIEVVHLNDRQKLVNKRFEFGNKICEKLEILLELSHNYTNNTSIRTKNKIVGELKNIMLEGTKQYEYSATVATILLTNPNYAEIKKLFEKCNLWTDEFVNLEKEVKYCALL